MNILNIALFGISLNNLSKKEKDFYNRYKEITDFRRYLTELIHSSSLKNEQFVIVNEFSEN